MRGLLSRRNRVSAFRIVIGVAVAAAASTSETRAADVTPNGSYQTVFDVPVPPALGAPRLALTYDSAASSTLAGIGWDVSVGWPTSITRDVRFGTPQWKRDSPWLWGSSPLIPTNAQACQQTGVCQYRVAPDALITVTIDLAAQPQKATVTLPSGITLEYEPITYDGTTYPAAPAGAETNVLGFLLSSATERNGFQTCFRHKHFGDRIRGNLAVLEEVAYGPTPIAGSCAAIFGSPTRHRIVFEYADLKQAGYFFTWTLRFGAPVSFESLLTRISIYAMGNKEYSFALVHDGTSSETRRPRLVKIQQEVTNAQGRSMTRTLRAFSYGDRSGQFNAQSVLDLGPLGSFPSSLTGAVSRPIRRASLFGTSNVFQIGQDQDTDAAPPSHATTEQWSFIDLNGDGLPDFQWGKETGSDPAAQWRTFETPAPPFGPTVTFGERTAQQQILINHGIAGSSLFTSRSRINSHAPTLEANYPWVPTSRGSVPIAGGPNAGFTSWIWLEGRGQTRTGMPTTVTAPEIANPAPVCPPTQGQDTRLWPQYPDGTFGGSRGSIGQALQQAVPFPPGGNKYFGNPVMSIAQGIFDGYHPTYSIASTLSGWADVDGDGLPEFVATPSSIERFAFDFGCTTITDPARFVTTALEKTLDSLFARQPFPASTGGQLDTSWHVGKIGGLAPNATNGLTLSSIPGPPGPTGLPLSYDLSTGTPEGFGFTLPVGGLVSATISSIINQSWIPIAAAAPGLTVDSFTPRSTPGYTLTIPAPSANAVMQGLGNLAANKASGSSIADFIMSLVKVNFDLTFASTANTNRSESRAQLMDLNADGLPDYLLYNSGPLIPGATPGSLVAYLNSPAGFGSATVINAGFNYTMAPPDTTRIDADLTKIDVATKSLTNPVNDAALLTAISLATSLPVLPGPADELCKSSGAVTGGLACAPYVAHLAEIASAADSMVALATPFLTSTTDVIPRERGHLSEMSTLSTYLKTSAALFANPVTAVAANLATVDIATAAADALLKTAGYLSRTVRQLNFPSRINAVGRGFSHLDGSAIGQTAAGWGVQTRGFVDLNGDALPDYVMTTDSEMSLKCAAGDWEVFWGTGTSAITAQRAFLPVSSCIKVPAPPADVAAIGYTTMPLNMDRVSRAASATGQIVDTIVHSYISLNDVNRDGRPDLLVAGDNANPWSAIETPVGGIAPRAWRVFRNNGLEFEMQPGQSITSPTTGRADVVPASPSAAALNVVYPTMRTTRAVATVANTLSRDVSETHASMLDIDGDGTPEILRRVHIKDPDPANPDREGLLVWQRAGGSSHDLMIEDRDPIGGGRQLIEYKPAAAFQWTGASPNGQPPQGGHYSLAGVAGNLVRSVTTEPLMGRAAGRSRIGFDYRLPFFDVEKRLATGFAIRTTTPLNPTTGGAIGASVQTVERSAQRSDGVNSQTLTRQQITGSGAPVRETLVSYVEQIVAPRPPNMLQGVFAAPSRSLTVEYPEGLVNAAAFDVGFDGRRPFDDRARFVNAGAGNRPGLRPGAATGGAAAFSSGNPTPLTYPSPHPPAPTAFTIEAWVRKTGGTADRTLVQQSGAYRLFVRFANGVDRVQLETGGTTIVATVPLTDRWTHVVATVGSGTARLYLNGVDAGSGATGAALTANGPLVVGCRQTGTTFDTCFGGEVGELRIYPQAWPHAPRVTDSETEYSLNLQAHDFGQPVRVLERRDLATWDDDSVTEYSYAQPSGPRIVRGALVRKAVRVLASDGQTSGNYLSVSQTAYDGLPIGQVGTGNVTTSAEFDGPAESAAAPAQLAVVTRTEYTDPLCPGRPTKVTDPEGALTTTTWDPTCAFVTASTNALGHTSSNTYYGLNATMWRSPRGPFGIFEPRGQFGQLAETIDANGAVTRQGYDEWGRLTTKFSPLDRADRPGERFEYADARCSDVFNPGEQPCDTMAFNALIAPSRTLTHTWDDAVERYRRTYEFGDGQVQGETLESGSAGWTISGARDFDAQGRVVRSYKLRYLPALPDAASDACPAAGTWCDVAGARDPLRAPSVATVQTAYDAQGRVFRTYGPGVPKCPDDPSTVDEDDGLPTCDAVVPAGNLGHVTRFEYLRPGAVRTSDARGVATINRSDVRGLLTRVEEYARGSSTPYSAVTLTYDRLGRRVTTTDHQGHTSSVRYDAMSRVRATDDPDQGASTFTYDRKSQLLEGIVATGDKTVHTYDLLGRITKTDYLRPKAGESVLVCCELPGGNLPNRVSPPDSWTIVEGFERDRHLIPIPPLPPPPLQLRPLRLTRGDLNDGVAKLQLPFDVTITRNDRFPAGTPVFVNTNGKVRFDRRGVEDLAPGTGDPLPTRESEIGLYPFYSDLDLRDGGLAFAVSGQAPNRRLDIEWNGILASNRGERVRVSLTILEHQSEVRFDYRAVPRDPRATIGIQNRSPELARAVVVAPATREGERSFVPAAGVGVSSRQPRDVSVLRLDATTAAQAELAVDGSGIKGERLRLGHRWFSRCANQPTGSCDVDRMTISYRDPERPDTIVRLLDGKTLADPRYLDAAGRGDALPWLDIPLPEKLAGRRFTLVFEFNPIRRLRNAVLWEVGPVQISTTTYEIEERVLRRYDSSEPDYYIHLNTAQKPEEAKPLLDLTLDVPGRIEDRSPTRAMPSSQAIEAVSGSSGFGGRLPAGRVVELAKLVGPLRDFTVEAWIRRGEATATQTVFSSEKIFALAVRADGKLECHVTSATSAIVSSDVLPADAWAHVALVRDGGAARCYINGVEQGAVTIPPTAAFVLARTSLGDATSTVSMDVDEVRLLGERRTADQILEDALRPLRPGPPRGDMIEIGFGNPGQPEADVSKAGNHGRRTGGALVPGIQGTALDTINAAQIEVPHSPSLQLPDAVTPEAWVKLQPTAIGPALILGKWSGAASAGWRLGLEPNSRRLRWETVTRITSPTGTRLAHAVFVTYESLDNGWHHVAATYDGTRLRVFIDGVPAHRTCSPVEPGTAPDPCTDPPLPEKCITEAVNLGDPATRSYGDAVCTEGTIENTEPVRAARDAQGTLHGYLDELRVSNYAKRGFEIAASSQVAAAFAQTLGREVELRNQLPVGPEIEKRVADERRAFDARGRMVSAWKHVRGQRASGDFVDRTALDNLDRIGANEYPTGEVLSSTYDLGFTERSLTGFGPFVAGQRPGRQTYLSEATSTVTGRIASLMFGNGVKSTYSYEEGPARAGGFGGELPRAQTIGKPGTSPLSQRTYTWDHVGNLLSANDPAVTYTASYTPDDLNRLRTATFSVAGQNLNFAYDYDSLGNLTSKEGVTQDYGRALSPACGAGVTSLPHAITRRTANQAVVGSLCYDESGRVVRDTNTLRNSIRHVSYFARGKTSRMSDRNGEYSFSYDGNGLRVGKIEPLGTTIEPFPHFREIPNNVESLYSGAGRLIARRAGSTPGDVFWFHLDHLGGTNLITDVNGAEDVSARIHYRPFGEALGAGAPQNDHAGSRLFTGKELDATGLYDFGARPYDPITGRFLQPDDVEFGVSAQALNRFTYSLNRPLVLIDPTGHAPGEARDLPRVPAPATLKPGQINVMPELELTAEDPLAKAAGQIMGAADAAMHQKVDPILHADKLLGSAQISANNVMTQHLLSVAHNMVGAAVMRTVFSQPTPVPRPRLGNQKFVRDAEAMGEVAARRAAQGAPVAGAPESGTFGRLTINGRNYYSQNANNVNVRPAGVNAVSPRHMEGGAFGSAMQAGERAYEATLYTDRAMCGYCWGAVRGYMRELGIRYLRVVEPNGVSYTIGPRP